MTESYVTKNNAAPGAEPMSADPTPRYIPVNPPEEEKEVGDWRRVLRVSRGKRDMSTVVPARPPAWAG